jgi:hypothetical protein
VGALIEHASRFSQALESHRSLSDVHYVAGRVAGCHDCAASPLLAACKPAWLEEVGDTNASRTQLQVRDTIHQLPGCSAATSEHLTDDVLFCIDIAVHLPGDNNLAVEVDDPLPQQHTERAQRRDRLLEARVWRVMSVPVTEWRVQAAKGNHA